MQLKTLKKANVKGKKVLLRVDYNVPLEDGKVMDDNRIQESLPTVNHLIKKGAKLIIMSHLGRPKGDNNDEFKMDPVAARLSELLKTEVKKVDSCLGEEVENAVKNLQEGEVLMLENTRFHKEEKENDKAFAKTLAGYADIYVSDAFGTVHRAHASTEGVAHYLDSYAGFLIEKEVEALTPLLKDPEKPFVLLIGGAKIDTKIGVIKSYLGKADTIMIGGALANTFVLAKGYDTGNSLVQEDKVDIAREIMLEAEASSTKLSTPGGFIVADEIGDSVLTADMEVTGIEGNMIMLDIGSQTTEKFSKILKEAKTIIWNGPMGLYEKEPFANGTKKLAKVLSKVDGKTYLGGGDTIDALKRFGISKDKFTHVSTGGGAMLEFLEGKELPGLKVLT